MGEIRSDLAGGKLRARHWALALLPSVIFVALVFGRHFRQEHLREQANTDPILSLASQVPSRRFDIPFWWHQASQQSATWSAALAACTAASIEQVNCRRVQIARTVWQMEADALAARLSSSPQPEIEPTLPPPPASEPLSGGARS